MAQKREEKKFAESVRKMTAEELGVELKSLQGRLYTLRSQAVTEKVENTAQFGMVRRNIARLLTEQTARRIKDAGGPRQTPKVPAAKAPKSAHAPDHKRPAKHAVSAAGKAHKPRAKTATKAK